MKTFFPKYVLMPALLVALLMLLFVQQSAARSLGEYNNALVEAESSLDYLIFDELDYSDPADKKVGQDVLDEIALALPAEEEIEHKGVGTNVNNAWLHAAVKSFSTETDSVKMSRLIASIHERIETMLVKAQNLQEAEARKSGKDEEKQRLAEILKREEYGTAEVQGQSPAARLYNAVVDWINSLFPKSKPVRTASKTDFAAFKTVLQIMIFTVVILLIAFLAYRFGPQLIKRYRKEKKTRTKQLILGEEIGPNVTTADLLAEAEALAVQGDVRGAIRKGYISLLFELSQRKLIGLAKHKTNRDYLRDLRKHLELRDNVGGLTAKYERYWYGRQTAVDGEWESFKERYTETLRRE